MNSWLKERKK